MVLFLSFYCRGFSPKWVRSHPQKLSLLLTSWGIYTLLVVINNQKICFETRGKKNYLNGVSYELSFLAVSLFGLKLSRMGLRTCCYASQEGSDQLDKEQAHQPGSRSTCCPRNLRTTIGPDLHWPSSYLQRALVCDFLQGESDCDRFGRGRTSVDAHSYNLSLKKGHVLGELCSFLLDLWVDFHCLLIDWVPGGPVFSLICRKKIKRQIMTQSNIPGYSLVDRSHK